jgi:hypothetical protein
MVTFCEMKIMKQDLRKPVIHLPMTLCRNLPMLVTKIKIDPKIPSFFPHMNNQFSQKKTSQQHNQKNTL